jgi:hypothetical protein
MKRVLKNIATSYINVQKSIRTDYDHYKLRKKIDKLNKLYGSKELTGQQKAEILSFYGRYGFKDIKCSWHRYYTACNGIHSVKYVPENIFYLLLEPKLNNYDFTSALGDKNLLDKLFPNIKHPEVVVKNINGLYYDISEIIDLDRVVKLCNTAGKMIIKPTIDSYGGKNVVLFQCSDGITNFKEKPIEQMLMDYEKNFVIQKVLKQHPLLEKLNSTSVNTFRVVSYLKDRESKVLSITVRMGKKGSTNDNVSTGGLSCGVRKDGTLNEVGYDLHGKKVTETDGGIKFSDIQFPFIAKLKDAATRLHIQAPHFRLISWDMTLDTSGEVVLIEYNIYGQECNSHQMHNGPVFAELLQELNGSGSFNL